MLHLNEVSADVAMTMANVRDKLRSASEGRALSKAAGVARKFGSDGGGYATKMGSAEAKSDLSSKLTTVGRKIGNKAVDSVKSGLRTAKEELGPGGASRTALKNMGKTAGEHWKGLYNKELAPGKPSNVAGRQMLKTAGKFWKDKLASIRDDVDLSVAVGVFSRKR